jgi:hypothetical protein
MLESLTRLANDLDKEGLLKEADALDEIVGLLSKLLKGRSAEGPDGETESNAESEQVELLGEKTRNFDICPGAIKAFGKIKSLLGDSPGEAVADMAIEAMKKTDELFEVEKNVLKSKSVTTQEVKTALDLYQEILYRVGALSAELNEELLNDFKFLNMHIEKIQNFQGHEPKDKEDEE